MTWMKIGRRLTSAVACAIALVACGGGAGTSPAATYPSSGAYGYLIKPSGSTPSLTTGLSLVHPATPDDEYEIEPVTSAITATAFVKSGSVDTALGRVSNIAAHALLYILDGDIKRVPLLANGEAPASRVTRAAISNACAFIVESNDYANPDNSRYVVSTKGADGVCGTSDDGAVDLQAGAAGFSLGSTSPADPPLAVFRDPVTRAPAAWLTSTSVLYLSPPSAVAVTAGSSRVLRAVGSAGASVLFEFGSPASSQLVLIDLRGAPFGASLNPVLTAGTGWQLIGFDASSYYVYRNSGTTTASTWKVLKIGRGAAPIATLLASGSGLLAASDMGVNVLYATIEEAAGNRLLRMAKAIPGTPTTLEFVAPTSLTTVLASSSGVHLFWHISGAGSASVSYQIEMRDEAWASLYTGDGGFPLFLLEASSLDFDNSANTTRFAFATGFGSRAFADAALVVYDSSTGTATTLGTLPGTAIFGSDPVLASVVGGPSDFVTGSATRITGGVAQGSSAQVFSAAAATPGSLSYTTTKR